MDAEALMYSMLASALVAWTVLLADYVKVMWQRRRR